METVGLKSQEHLFYANQMTKEKLTLIECPRDAMQGWSEYIPVEKKVEYLNELLKVGFDTLDFGSFVSPKVIPQLRDTADVLNRLDLSSTTTKLLAIVANSRGAEEAVTYEQIAYLGFPFSVSEEFQKRNANSTIDEALKRVQEIQSLCVNSGKELVIYISMGFGNPYGERWDADLVIDRVKQLDDAGIRIIALSDTIGKSNRENITHLFTHLIPAFPYIQFGAHLHSSPSTWKEKLSAAYDSGCRRFDSALKGIGGCPMADDTLVGNLATENVIDFFGGTRELGLNPDPYAKSLRIASEIFQSPSSVIHS
jgi:hydroxymethylglutaryl-CoA lyase